MCYQEIEMLQLKSRFVLFLIMMILAGVGGSALVRSSQDPGYKYITALLVSVTDSLTFISVKSLFKVRLFLLSN